MKSKQGFVCLFWMKKQWNCCNSASNVENGKHGVCVRDDEQNNAQTHYLTPFFYFLLLLFLFLCVFFLGFSNSSRSTEMMRSRITAVLVKLNQLVTFFLFFILKAICSLLLKKLFLRFSINLWCSNLNKIIVKQTFSCLVLYCLLTFVFDDISDRIWKYRFAL